MAMRRAGTSLAQRLRRGHFLSRAAGRVLRELRGVLTTLVLSTTRPRLDRATIVTLNADEENATAQAVLLGHAEPQTRTTLVSPDPVVTREAVRLAARRLDLPVPDRMRCLELGYWTLLRQYRLAAETYSTHVLLPGRDFSGRRRHVHLTHGSGPKPDTTFRGPTNVLASITPQWVASQLQEYGLPADTEVIEYMPRLEIMRKSVGDRSIIERLGFDPSKQLVVWAPTYRKVHRGRELRVSGSPVSLDTADAQGMTMRQIRDRIVAAGDQFVVKAHPHEADDYGRLGTPVLTNAALREKEVTPYELFGVADLVITDYSSVYTERAALGLRYELFQPDLEKFKSSYRGLR